jgi:hypothetical protein
MPAERKDGVLTELREEASDPSEQVANYLMFKARLIVPRSDWIFCWRRLIA